MLSVDRIEIDAGCRRHMRLLQHLLGEAVRVIGEAVGGAGGRRDLTQIRSGDIGEAHDELLRMVRKKLRRDHGYENGAHRGITRMGIPAEVVLDEWEALVSHTDDIAARFISIFETHLAPADWQESLDTDDARELARTLAQLQVTARQVLVAALDASVARLGRERLGQLIDR